MRHPQPQPSGGTKAIGWIVGIVAGLAAFWFAKNLVSGGFAKPDWQTRTVAGVTLESPVKFSPSKENIPADVKRMTDSFETYEGKLGRDSFHVGVMHVRYKAGVPLSIDGALAGSIRGGAAKLGDNNPQFTPQNVTVAGLDGRRAKYSTTYRGRQASTEVLVLRRGQDMWMVMCATDGQKLGTDVFERIIGSVQIK